MYWFNGLKALPNGNSGVACINPTWLTDDTPLDSISINDNLITPVLPFKIILFVSVDVEYTFINGDSIRVEKRFIPAIVWSNVILT